MSEIKMNHWIQHADLVSTDETLVSLSEAIDLFKNYDWQSEITYMAELEASGEDNCPAGIGFVPEDGRFLHICPVNANNAILFYAYPEQKKRLGFIPVTSQAESSCDSFPLAKIPQAITLFFQNDHQGLLDLCANN